MIEEKQDSILKALQGKLVASCQPVDFGPMDRVDIVVAMAQASLNGGAGGLRIEGAEKVKAVVKAVDAPVIGIIKRDFEDSDVRITALMEDVQALLNAGAPIIAIDATDRPRPVPAEVLIKAAKEGGALVMADCSTVEEGLAAKACGADIIGSTMSGYTGGPVPKEPDFDMVSQLNAAGCFVMAEGRYNTPELAAEAIKAGASSVTVGSAITRIEHICGWFSGAIEQARK